MRSATRQSVARLGRGMPLRGSSVASTVLIFSAACVGPGTEDWAHCEPLTASAAAEIVGACGGETGPLDQCPSLDAWLSDLDALCRALD